MKKKTISILMSALLTMAAMITGCGNTDNVETKEAIETQNEQTSEAMTVCRLYQKLYSNSLK